MPNPLQYGALGGGGRNTSLHSAKRLSVKARWCCDSYTADAARPAAMESTDATAGGVIQGSGMSRIFNNAVQPASGEKMTVDTRANFHWLQIGKMFRSVAKTQEVQRGLSRALFKYITDNRVPHGTLFAYA
eukprot:4720788-Pleurochrysis_carterae.AAC.1